MTIKVRMVQTGNDSYDELWRGVWGGIQQSGPVHRHTREDLVRVVSRLGGVRTILDVGCGSGDNLAGLAALKRYDLAGTDISKEALQLAQQRVPSARLLELNVEHDALSEQFDLVVSVQVLEHIEDDVRAIRNIAAMSSRYVFTSTIAGRMRPSERAIGHVRNYTRDELTRKLERAGLKVAWCRGWGFPFYSPIYRSIAEHIPGGPPTGRVDGVAKVTAGLLYHLYRLNLPGRGDVVSALAVHPD
jgi:2-polyprenyl-3-methyl-5-hydroxy-6-metoxy-1,4-benzoquinol methylase